MNEQSIGEEPVDDDQITDELVERLPLPPPLTTIEAPLLDAEVDNIPGNIVIDKNGKLLLRYLSYNGSVGDLIAIYNNFVLKKIPSILKSRYLALPDGTRIIFTNPQNILPHESKLMNEDSRLLLPRQARILKDTYSFCVVADVKHVHPDGETTIIIGGAKHVVVVNASEQLLIIDDDQYTIEMDGIPYNIPIDDVEYEIAVSDVDKKIIINGFEEDIDIEGKPKIIVFGGQEQIRKNMLIGCIPAMLGSVVDNLISPFRYTKEQLLQVGECSYDQGGYFIIKGEERIILIQERLRTNRIMIYTAKDGKLEAMVTSNSIRGSTVVRLRKAQDKSIRLHFSLLSSTKAKKTPKEVEGEEEAIIQGITEESPGTGTNYETVCVLQIFRILGALVVNERGEDILGFGDVNRIVSYIIQFVPEDWKKDILTELQGSFTATLKVGDDFFDIYSKSNLRKRWERIRSTPPGKSGRGIKAKPTMDNPLGESTWVTQTIPAIKRSVLEKIFSHMNGEDIDYSPLLANKSSPELAQLAWKKINYLAIMTARFAETTYGRRPMDNRDHWSNKRLDTAGNLIEQLFRQLWDDTVDDLQANLANSTIDVNAVYDTYKSDLITGGLESSFIPNNWGATNRVRFRKKQQNVTDKLDRGQSIVAAVSHLTQVNKPTNRRVKQASIRGVQLSQAGYIDVVDTPSGGAVGLVLRKAITCWISVSRSYNKIKELSRDYIVDKQDKDHNDLLMINGTPFSWCNGPKLRSFLLEIRRSSSQIKFDVAIVYKKPILFISTESGRPTRPLLIVNKNLVPVIEEKKLWKAPIDVLLREGALEYMDPWELHTHGLVATSVYSLAFTRESLARNRYLLTQYESQLSKAKADLELYPRPENLTEEEMESKIEEIKKGGIKQPLNGDENSDPVANWLWAKTEHERIMGYIDKTRTNIRRQEVKKYTHVEMDPTALLGLVSSLEPFSANVPGPRNTFQCNMQRQAIGINYSNPDTRFSKKDMILNYPSRAVAGTQMQKLLGLDDLPAGQNIVMAIMTWADNEEDGIIVKKEALQRGLFVNTVFHSSEIILEKKPRKESRKTVGDYLITTIVEEGDYTVRPVKPFPGHTMDNYANLDDDGIPIPDSVVSAGDALIGVIRIITTVTIKQKRDALGRVLSTTRSQERSYVDKSVYVNPWEGGIVDKVLISRTVEGNLAIKVRVRSVGIPIIGDKIATRHAQKSVIARIVEERFLPHTKDGIVPDVILNPHSLPKRMTIGTLIEIVTSKYASLAGERINATAFNATFDLQIFMELLETIYGFNKFGTEKLINPKTGEDYPAEIMIGPSHYQLLKHKVEKKIHARAEGPISALTRQAVKGKQRGGGINFGHMERSAAASYGAAHFLHERLGPDIISTAFCKDCRKITVNKVLEEQGGCVHCSSNETFQCEIPYSMISLMNFAAMAGVRTGLLTEEEGLEELLRGLSGLITEGRMEEEIISEGELEEFELEY